MRPGGATTQHRSNCNVTDHRPLAYDVCGVTVCRKIMFLTAESRTAYSRGFIYNIVTNDTDAVQMTCNQIFSVVSSPLRIIVAMVLLYGQLGIAAFAALVLLICMIPAQVRPSTARTSVSYAVVGAGRHLGTRTLTSRVLCGVAPPCRGDSMRRRAASRDITEQCFCSGSFAYLLYSLYSACASGHRTHSRGITPLSKAGGPVSCVRLS